MVLHKCALNPIRVTPVSNRDLASVAVIVWGIAMLLGVFIGAPLLLGMQVDVGLIINALAAMGAFGAAVAAVWVATGDRYGGE